MKLVSLCLKNSPKRQQFGAKSKNEMSQKHLLLFDGFSGVVHDLLDFVEAEHLVDLVERLVSSLESVEHLHLDLRELEVVHQPLQVVQLSVRASQQLLLQPLLAQQLLRAAATQQCLRPRQQWDCANILTLSCRRRAVCGRAGGRARGPAPPAAGTASLCPAAASVAATIHR